MFPKTDFEKALAKFWDELEKRLQDLPCVVTHHVDLEACNKAGLAPFRDLRVPCYAVKGCKWICTKAITIRPYDFYRSKEFIEIMKNLTN